MWKITLAVLILILAAVTATRASSSLPDARAPAPDSISMNVRAADSAGDELRVGTRLITSYAEVIGCKFAAGPRTLTVKSLIWGLDRQQRLLPAHFEYVDQLGNATVVDQVDDCIQVFQELTEVRNFFTTQAGTEVLVDAIQFGINAQGYLVTMSMRGSTVEGGRAVATGYYSLGDEDPAPQQACACVWSVQCEQGGCSTPAGCTSMGDCGCAGTGRCTTSSTCTCPPAGVCTLPGTACSTDPADPGKCKCL